MVYQTRHPQFNRQFRCNYTIGASQFFSAGSIRIAFPLTLPSPQGEGFRAAAVSGDGKRSDCSGAESDSPSPRGRGPG